MTNLSEASQQFDSTSAVGAMLMPQLPPHFVGMILAGLATSTLSVYLDELALSAPAHAHQTTAGISLLSEEYSGSAIGELRRLSGLTWDQIARLFNVSRRSLHFWASGKAMTSANEEHLHRLLAVIRKVDRGSGAANRAVLLVALDDGTIPFDLLADGQYERVASLLYRTGGLPRLMPPRLSDETKAARAPLSTEELATAFQDRVHRETGVAHAAKSVKVRSGR